MKNNLSLLLAVGFVTSGCATVSPNASTNTETAAQTPAHTAAQQQAATPASAGPFVVNENWFGTYTCAQGLTTGNLTIQSISAGRITAILNFTIKSRERGILELHADIPSKGSVYEFKPGKWFKSVQSIYPTGFKGIVSAKDGAFKGGATGRNCTDFSFSKAPFSNDSPWDLQRKKMEKDIEEIKEKTKVAYAKKQKERQQFIDAYLIRITGSSESKEYAITDQSLLTSVAGSCKDISRKITIAPKNNTRKPVSVTVRWSLQRTYKPYNINKDDAIHLDKTYTLNAANNYTVNDTIDYPCVLTAGRFHSAAFSLIGKITGSSKEQSGFNTALEKSSFGYDITQATWSTQ